VTTETGSAAGTEAPRLGRLLPRREAAEILGAFAALLEGHALALVDARGVTVAEAGGAVASLTDVWRSEIVLGEHALGALEVRPAPAGRVGEAAVAALLAGVTRSVVTSAGRRELVAETLERYREVNLLYRLGDVLGGTFDAVALPERVLEEALRLIASDGAALVVDAHGDETGSWVAQGTLVGPDGRNAFERTRAGLADDARPAILVEAPDAAGAIGAATALSVSLWAPLRAGERTLGGVLLTRARDALVFTAGDEKLLTALATQAAAYLDNARLHRRSLAQARLAQELQLAHDVQARLMPRVMPERSGWRVSASWTPAREVAGDFFDAIAVGDDIAVAVGDVADKGMAAALFMALTRSVLRASAAPGRSAGEVVARANALLCADATDGMFVTLAYALLEPGGSVRYANAGHNPPLVVRADGRIEPLGRTGILVGWDEDAAFGEARAVLAPGDLLVLFTDGVTEARDAHGAEYGEERFERVAVLHRAAGAAGVLRELLDDLAAFVGDAEPYDDATVMVIAWEPEDSPEGREERSALG
jgi:serine phosphatase RsbU (regulator of sigma subunit)